MIKILPRLLSPFHQHVINIIYCNKLIHIIILIHPCFPLSGAIYVIMYSSKQQAVNIIVAPHRCRRATWVAVRRNPVSVVAVVWSVQVLQAIKLRKNIRPSSFVHGRWLRLILLSQRWRVNMVNLVVGGEWEEVKKRGATNAIIKQTNGCDNRGYGAQRLARPTERTDTAASAEAHQDLHFQPQER